MACRTWCAACSPVLPQAEAMSAAVSATRSAMGPARRGSPRTMSGSGDAAVSCMSVSPPDDFRGDCSGFPAPAGRHGDDADAVIRFPRGAAPCRTRRPRTTDRVLEIGTGSGYQTAVLSLLVRHVFTIEMRPGGGFWGGARLREIG